jgi:hypothetical protein
MEESASPSLFVVYPESKVLEWPCDATDELGPPLSLSTSPFKPYGVSCCVEVDDSCLPVAEDPHDEEKDADE